MKTAKRVVVLHAEVVSIREIQKAAAVQIAALNGNVADLKHMLLQQAKTLGAIMARTDTLVPERQGPQGMVYNPQILWGGTKMPSKKDLPDPGLSPPGDLTDEQMRHRQKWAMVYVEEIAAPSKMSSEEAFRFYDFLKRRCDAKLAALKEEMR